MKRLLLKSDGKRNPPMARKPQPSPPHEEKSEVATTTSPTTGTPEVTPERRHEMAAHLVDRFALWSGAAGLIPVPVLDWVTVGGGADPDGAASFANLRGCVQRKQGKGADREPGRIDR